MAVITEPNTLPAHVRGFREPSLGWTSQDIEPSNAAAEAVFPRPMLESDLAATDLLRDALDRASFTEEGVRNALSDQSHRLELKRADYPLYERRLAHGCPLHTMIKLFMMRLWVDEESVTAAFAPDRLKRLLELGIFERGSPGVRSRCTFAICNGLRIAHDRVGSQSEDPQRDHVLGVNASAFTLANLTLRRRVGSTLDIGAGSGIQAFLAAHHSDEVIATDTNPRALDYLSFNARLNRVENIECRLGSLFAPVEGRRFDLITCNPPYVISPESTFTFRDSGMPGDSVCEQVVRQAPAFLNEDGYACILCNWTHRKDQEWSEPIERWVSENGCDTWVVRGGIEDPLTYAAVWNRTRDRELYAAALDRWQEYYKGAGIEAISMGAVILHRRKATRNWFRAEDWPEKPAGPCGDHILKVFDNETISQGLTDDQMLEHTFSLVDEHQVDQQLKCRNGELVCQSRQLKLSSGLKYQFNLDAPSLCLVSQLDGKHTVGEAIHELSRYSGGAIDQIQPRALEIVRQLLACGFLVSHSAGQSPAPCRRVAESRADVRTGPGAAPDQQRP